MAEGSSVIVCCRFRPPNRAEREMQSPQVVQVGSDRMSVRLQMPSGLTPPFQFDRVFGTDSTQEEVFEYTAKPFVAEIISGYNTCIFAYGQTGSGKTHSMMGQQGTPQAGIIPRITEAIFNAIEEADEAIEFTVKVSYVEIYTEKIRDLLTPSKDNLRIRESGVGIWIEDVTEVYVASIEEVLGIMEQGMTNRAVAATQMNADSSRSHSVFMLTLGQRNTKTGTKKGAKLFLVDLAGSEKVEKTGAAGQTLKEAQHINKSLSALGNVINALTTPGKKHIPYRDSKLTRLLSDSLGGNSKTCLVITGSPCDYNAEETLSTLRFGARAKTIKNRAVVNEEKSVEEYKRLLQNAYMKIAAQDKLIIALEGDVRELQTCLSAVAPEHLTAPIPEIKQRAIADFWSARAGAAAMSEATGVHMEVKSYEEKLPATPRRDLSLDTDGEPSTPSRPPSALDSEYSAGSAAPSPVAALTSPPPAHPPPSIYPMSPAKIGRAHV